MIGPPADHIPRASLFRPAPRPAPRRRDKRARFKQVFMGVSGSGSLPTPQSSSTPPPQSCSTTPPQFSSGHPTNQHTDLPNQHLGPSNQHPPPILNLHNVANTCYAVATVQVMHSIGLHNYMLAGQTPHEMNLSNLLTHILNGTAPSPDLVPLVMALNLCLPPQNFFTIGRMECAAEFLASLFSSISLGPHFSTFESQAICPVCSAVAISNLPNSISNLLLTLQSVRGVVPVNVSNLVAGKDP